MDSKFSQPPQKISPDKLWIFVLLIRIIYFSGGRGRFQYRCKREAMLGFCEFYDLKNLIQRTICSKIPENPPCIDLLLTNMYRSSCDSYFL